MTSPGTRDHRWLGLVTISVAQLMVVLDATIVNIALPDAQRDLHFGQNDLQWIITAYALAFGSLLLLGGRIGDLFGRKRSFVVGLVGFAVASAVGGAATSFGMLVTARAFQGLFGALLAPAALSLLAVTFTEPAERNKAFGVFGAVAGGGGAVGLVLGGLLTEYLSWRYCLFVNLIFAAAAVVGAWLFLSDHEKQGGSLDIPGTILASVGLFGIVYGFSHAEPTQPGASARWGDPVTVVALAGGAVLIVAFVLLQRRVAHPLLPMRVVWDRVRGGSYLAVGITGIAIFGVFLFLTLYLQQIAHYSPVINGVAFLPLTAAIMTSSTTSNIVLLPRFGPRLLVVSGMVLGAIGLALLVRLPVHASYAADLLPSLLVMGLGFGLIFAPAFNSAVLGVEPHDAGVASAMVNTMQQVSGSIGTALLSTIVGSVTASYVSAHPGPSAGVTGALHAYHVVFVVSALVFVGGAVICGLLIRGKKDVDRIAAAAPQQELAAVG